MQSVSIFLSQAGFCAKFQNGFYTIVDWNLSEKSGSVNTFLEYNSNPLKDMPSINRIWITLSLYPYQGKLPVESVSQILHIVN